LLVTAFPRYLVFATTVSSATSSPSATTGATAACTSITLDGITVPGNGTINLSKLKTGAKVTFSGTTFWEYFDANYPFIKVGGTDIEINATEGAILDGNGQAWWDGLGSNGGVAK
jgi:polygalacturonase